MKAFVDQDLCIGCGICEGDCPSIFKMQPDGKAIAKEGEVPEEALDDAMTAKSDCPVEAILIG